MNDRVELLLMRLRDAVRPGRAEAAREPASHLALLEDDFVRGGMTREEASLAAPSAEPHERRRSTARPGPSCGSTTRAGT